MPHAIRRMRPATSISVPLVALAMALGIVSVAASPGSVAAATTTVRITDRLEPDELRVATGTTVRWVNADGERHRMRSQSGPDEFDSGNLEPGESFSIRLSVAGTYTYLDERDDEDSRYFGRIVVGGEGGASDGGGSGGATTATAASVGMAGRTFGPSTVTIAAGGSVTWRNDDDRAHTVTATDGAFNSGTMNEGAAWKRTFREAGTFRYLCAIHPEMTGTVVVKATGSSQPKPAPKPTPTPATPAPTVGSDGEAAPPDVTAEARDFAFVPAELSVPVGTRLTWRNTGQAAHTVTAEDGSFDSGMIAAGSSWSQVFASAGTFRFVCAFHPAMTGVVEVTAAAAGAAKSPEPTATPTPTAPAAAVAVPTPPAEPPAAQEPDTAVAASRTAGPNAELMARVGIVGLLIGGSVLLFARLVGGTAGRRPEEEISGS